MSDASLLDRLRALHEHGDEAHPQDIAREFSTAMELIESLAFRLALAGKFVEHGIYCGYTKDEILNICDLSKPLGDYDHEPGPDV